MVSDNYWRYDGVCTLCTALHCFPKEITHYSCAVKHLQQMIAILISVHDRKSVNWDVSLDSDFSSETWNLTETSSEKGNLTNNSAQRCETWLVEKNKTWLSGRHKIWTHHYSPLHPTHVSDYFYWIKKSTPLNLTVYWVMNHWKLLNSQGHHILFLYLSLSSYDILQAHFITDQLLKQPFSSPRCQTPSCHLLHTLFQSHPLHQSEFWGKLIIASPVCEIWKIKEFHVIILLYFRTSERNRS